MIQYSLERKSTHQRAKANGPEVFIPDFQNSIQRGHLKNTKNECVLPNEDECVNLMKDTDWPL